VGPAEGAEARTEVGCEPAVVGLHDRFGNAVVTSALTGDALGALGDAVVVELALAVVSGMGTAEACRPATGAHPRAWREARADWQDPALGDVGARTGGRPLPPETLARFNRAFGHDFTHVRVHVDSRAAVAAEALQAHAFAIGADLWFARGECAPGTPEGDRLLAHELTHVVQFDTGRLSQCAGGVSSPSDPSELVLRDYLSWYVETWYDGRRPASLGASVKDPPTDRGPRSAT
jgi:hypothetical protein